MTRSWPSLRTPWLPLLTGWPVLVWALPRWTGPGESRWHLVPLALLAIAVGARVGRPPFWQRPGSGPSGERTLLPAVSVGFLWLYILSLPVAPPLLQGMGLAATLATLWSQRLWGHPWAPGVWGALLLALPSLPSLLFVFGYPWRRGTTIVTAQLLRLSGLNVDADGTQLRWEGGTVAVDAPCSGLYMGWAVAVLLVALWLFVDADFVTSIKTFAAALVLVLMVNVLRSAALFHLERLQQSPGPWREVLRQHGWHHDAVGIALFLPMCFFLVRTWEVSWKGSEEPGEVPSKAQTPEGSNPRPLHVVWVVGLLTAAVLPLWTRSPVEPVDSAGFPGWPATFEGRVLESLPLTQREAHFANGFPGRVGRFHDGEREIILRWLDRPTRQLHPAVECFRAHGYEIDHRPWQLDGAGRPWSSFEAHLPPEDPLRVRERVLATDGQQWADVSAWYWAALLGRSQGPWWSTVVAEPVAQSSDSPGDGI